jgi:hypothetical protein
MNQLTNLKSLILIPLALACFSLAPKVIAQWSPLSCNTSEGRQALSNLTTGTGDTAFGGEALFSNTVGNDNTATGCGALSSNVDGFENTATGFQALENNTSGYHNTANGAEALLRNTTGHDNTAVGLEALFLNTTGTANTAVGSGALFSNSGGVENTAMGASALFNNTTGNNNTAVGNGALFSNNSGKENTATGDKALQNNTSGELNTAFGAEALVSNTTGIGNTAIGDAALFNTTGNSNIALGFAAGALLTTGDQNIDIGHEGIPGESDTIRIGFQGIQIATYIAGISGTTIVGDAVFVNLNGQLGVGGIGVSSARFKEEIKPMDKTSEVIPALKPVTFRYKKELDPKGIPQFGLVAEEVEKVNPDLITRDRDGKPYTVRYEVVNAMLLNEFLKEHRQVQDQQKEIDALKAQLKEQSALIQKVSDKMELTNPSPQLVADNH